MCSIKLRSFKIRIDLNVSLSIKIKLYSLLHIFYAISQFQGGWINCDESCPLMKYQNNEEIKKDFDNIKKKAPDSIQVESLGTSVKGADLWSIRLNKENSVDLRPMVKLVGNMHGNEVLGRELLLHMAKYIVSASETLENNLNLQDDKLLKRAANIFNTTDLWILPTMNPDGYVYYFC